MTISIRVERFRACAQAELSCSPTALLCGQNDQGKSSTLSAVACVLTGKSLEPFGLTKAKANLLVRTGSKSASARIKTAAGEAIMSWPGLEYETTGDAPHASAFAAGTASFALIPPKERAAAIEPYIKATPTLVDVRQELGETFGAAALDKIWSLIEQDGWDKFHDARATLGTKTTGAWGQLTGERFGTEKARTWAPDDWDEDLIDIGIEQLEVNAREARAALESALGGHAVDQAQIEGLRAAAADIESRISSVAVAEAKVAESAAAVVAAREARDQLPSGTSPTALPCSHCGKMNFISRRPGLPDSLEKAVLIDEAVLKQNRLDLASADGKISRREGASQEALREQTVARASLETARNAEATIANMGERPGSADVVSSARAKVAETERAVVMLKQVLEARKLYSTWSVNAKLVAALAPNGLRAKKLGETVAAFNLSYLYPLCETAKWPQVSISEDLEVLVGAYPYSLCGASNQWRARVILQLAQAKLDGSTMVVIDAADVLDAPGRNGLFAVLKEHQIPALIGMTLSRPELAPDLAAAGRGQTVWITGGQTRVIGAEPEAAE